MNSKVSEIGLAIKQICEEKKISYESVIKTVEAALAVAYRKDFGEKNQNIQVDFDPETGGARVFDEKTVVADELKEVWEKEKAEREAAEAAAAEQPQPATPPATEAAPAAPAEAAAEKTEEVVEEEEERFDPKTMFSLAEAKEKKADAKLGDVIRTELFPPSAYGRMAAQTAKQVIIQKLREAERENLFNEYKDKEGAIINAVIQRVEGRMVLIDLGAATALMPPGEQIPTEHYNPGQRVKVFVVSVTMTSKGPEIIVSRGHAQMVAQLFSMEVPEIAAGSVEIKNVAREAGSRTKVAVASNQKNIDPVGSCVGQRGTRVQTIISELGGEKIDIIQYDENPIQFITNALSPAKVLTIKLNEEEKIATAEVKEDQLSLAIGKSGQNVRLAARLTGWKIDIVSEGKTPEQMAAEKLARANEKSAEAGDATTTEQTTETPATETTETPAAEAPTDAPAAETATQSEQNETNEQKEEEAPQA